jgi:MscS family membrane protein
VSAIAMALAPPDWLPRNLLRPGPYQIQLWQWLALPAAALAAWVAGRILGRITRIVAGYVGRRTPGKATLLDSLAGPLALGWFAAVGTALVDLLDLPGTAEARAHRILLGAFFVALFWALFRCIDVAGTAIQSATFPVSDPARRSLLALGSRVAKVIVGALAIVAVVSALGYPVESLIAGLGIGGLAIALAAQKTLANLFGAFAIGFDQPIREGDYVRIDNVTGTVEAIGLRSTRLRTDARTLVSIPNGLLADMRTENFAHRDRLLFSAVLGLSYDTTAAQMRTVLASIEAELRGHPMVYPRGISVRFRSLGESTLDVEVGAFFATTDWDEFTSIRQELLLRMLDIVERAGTSLAFPTRSVHLVRNGGHQP